MVESPSHRRGVVLDVGSTPSRCEGDNAKLDSVYMLDSGRFISTAGF